MGSVWRHISLYTSAVYSVSTILAFSCFSFLIWTISFLMSQSFLKGGHNLEYPWEEKNLISCKQKLAFAIMLYDGLKPIAVKELKSSWSSESWATDTHSDGFCNFAKAQIGLWKCVDCLFFFIMNEGRFSCQQHVRFTKLLKNSLPSIPISI